MSNSNTRSGWVVEVDDTSFEQVVIAGSSERPVVVDFWAEWCAPCRALGPVLESLAAEYDGAFLLAKVDTESAQRTAVEYGIQSIPAVKAFRDGKVVAEFVGAQPEVAVRQFAAMQESGTGRSLAQIEIQAGRHGEAESLLEAARLGSELDAELDQLRASVRLETAGQIDCAALQPSRHRATIPSCCRSYCWRRW